MTLQPRAPAIVVRQWVITLSRIFKEPSNAAADGDPSVNTLFGQYSRSPPNSPQYQRSGPK